MNEINVKGKNFDLRVAKILKREGSVITLELHCDDRTPFDIQDGDAFVTLYVPRIVVFDALVPPVDG